jgi:alpha-glucosidase
MKALTEGRYLGRRGIFVEFALDHGVVLRVGILEPDIGRVVLLAAGGYRLDRSWTIAPGGLEPGFAGRSRDEVVGFACPPVEVTATGEKVILSASSLTAEVRLSPFGIAWYRTGEQQPFLSDRPTQAYFLSCLTGALKHVVTRRATERHYGIGDKGGSLDRTGRHFRIDAVDSCGYDAQSSDPLYKMIPFLLVTEGAGAHGIFYDNLAVGEIDLGATIDNYHGLFRTYQAEDGDLDYYVLSGPKVRQVVRRFSWLTGGQAFAPKWSLGFAATSMTIADAPDADTRVTDFIEKCRTYKIPCDGFHFGSGYSSIGTRRYAFNWNRSKFPDPGATMNRLNAAGMQTVANLKPCLLDDHPRLSEAVGKRILVLDGKTGLPAVAQFWDGLGFHLDFTNPAGRAFWREGIETALLDYGIAAIWNDNNEYEIWDEDAMCDGDGRPFAQRFARPVQALLMTKLAHETQSSRSPTSRPYLITRAGPAGISRYGQTWSGDNETAWKTLRFNLTQGLNMSLSGLYNIGHDVGGFHGPSPTSELFCRFVEFCSLWPRFVMNSWKDDGVVNLPWMHPDVLIEVQNAIKLRYRLLPYLYTQMWRAARYDEPVVLPLFYAFSEDVNARDTEDAYLLGPDLLVAPVLEEGAQERCVHLPDHSGGWYNFHDGRHFDGGTIARVAAPLGRLPLFARAGSMIPVSAQLDGIDVARDLQRQLVVFGVPEDQERTELYEDDGETADWRGGAGLICQFELTPDGRSAILSMKTEGRYCPAFGAITVRPVSSQIDIDVKPGSGVLALTLGASWIES